MDKKLLIVDGNSLANRAFYALPFLSNHSGQPSGAIFGFANILIKVIHSEKPTHIVIAFDHARKTFRNELYPEYKILQHRLAGDGDADVAQGLIPGDAGGGGDHIAPQEQSQYHAEQLQP